MDTFYYKHKWFIVGQCIVAQFILAALGIYFQNNNLSGHVIGCGVLLVIVSFILGFIVEHNQGYSDKLFVEHPSVKSFLDYTSGSFCCA